MSENPNIDIDDEFGAEPPFEDPPAESDDDIMATLEEVQAEITARAEGTEPPAAAGDDDDSEPEPAASEGAAAPESSWELASVAQQLGVADMQTAANGYVSAMVQLTNDPSGGLAKLADHYIADPQAAQQLIAHLAAKHNLDVLDVDVDEYKAQQPLAQKDNTIARLEATVMALQVGQLAAKGDYPLIEDKAVQQQIAQYSLQYGLPLEQAYNVAVHSDANLSKKHLAAVGATNKDKGTEPAAEQARQNRVRRARAADLPRGAAGARSVAPSGDDIHDLVKEIASEIGFTN